MDALLHPKPELLISSLKSQPPVIYVTSGNAEDVKTFALKAQNLSMAVVTKESLFQGKGLKNELILLQNLSSDLQGLVDCEVLLRPSNFGGTWQSSFSWNVVMKRHVVVGKGTWKGLGKRQARTLFRGRGEHTTHQSASGGLFVGEESFHDALSTVFEPKEEAKMFKLSIWP